MDKDSVFLADGTCAKLGDWIFCEFKLQTIEEVEDGNITSVSDGWFTHGGNCLNDRCFPINKRNNNISKTITLLDNEICRIKLNLNIPDIHHKFIGFWVKACAEEDDKKMNEILDQAKNFSKKICEKVKGFGYEIIDGVRLFRNR